MAITQSLLVSRAITELTGREVELVGIDSAGDKTRELLTQIGGTGRIREFDAGELAGGRS